MGPRIREDNGGEGAHEGRPYGDAEGEGEESVIGSGDSSASALLRLA